MVKRAKNVEPLEKSRSSCILLMIIIVVSHIIIRLRNRFPASLHSEKVHMIIEFICHLQGLSDWWRCTPSTPF